MYNPVSHVCYITFKRGNFKGKYPPTVARSIAINNSSITRSLLWCYIHRASLRQWNITFLSLITKLVTFLISQVNMADSCWMIFSFIKKTSLDLIWYFWKGGEIIQNDFCPLGWKVLSRNCMHGISKDLLTQWLHWLPAGHDFLKFIFLQTKAVNA